eukprot:maker-scaffold_8-snap-gene-4.9-mRNA-1 protein AED:0.27 eAED:0.27 QI:96/1/1/1/0/0.5/2/726/76
MQNDNGENVDLYIPRKCSWTNRLITSQDRASVQISIAEVDPETGLAIKGKNKTVALCGYIRAKGEGDMALTKLASA